MPRPSRAWPGSVDPIFLTLAEVLDIHQDQVARYGGVPGVRDMSLLDSALAQPQAGAGNAYVHPDLFSMAAAYLFHIIRNHPFVDGNKRTAVVAALLFLDLNGVEVTASEADLEAMAWEAAGSEKGKTDLAEWFRRHSTMK